MGFRVDCYDTLIKNGHIYDPERGVDMIGHIGILEPCTGANHCGR